MIFRCYIMNFPASATQINAVSPAHAAATFAAERCVYAADVVVCPEGDARYFVTWRSGPMEPAFRVYHVTPNAMTRWTAESDDGDREHVTT